MIVVVMDGQLPPRFDHKTLELPAVPAAGDSVLIGVDQYRVKEVNWDLSVPVQITILVK